jgi:pre-mRNA-splicing factor SYF1
MLTLVLYYFLIHHDDGAFLGSQLTYYVMTVVIDLHMARLEDLAARRPLLLSSVLLRQNPHNVYEWHKRVALFKDDPEKTIETYTDAVMTVDPWKATGKPHSLWVAFARYYEANDDIDNARVIFDRATRVAYKSIEDLANLWCEAVEMELRHNNHTHAIALLKRATTVPRHTSSTKWTPLTSSAADQCTHYIHCTIVVPLIVISISICVCVVCLLFELVVAVQDKVYRSTKLWSLYADLEENFGTLESTKAVYEQMIHIKVATPKVIINYATYLEVHFIHSLLIHYHRIIMPYHIISMMTYSIMEGGLGW